MASVFSTESGPTLHLFSTPFVLQRRWKPNRGSLSCWNKLYLLAISTHWGHIPFSSPLCPHLYFSPVWVASSRSAPMYSQPHLCAVIDWGKRTFSTASLVPNRINMTGDERVSFNVIWVWQWCGNNLICKLRWSLKQLSLNNNYQQTKI